MAILKAYIYLYISMLKIGIIGDAIIYQDAGIHYYVKNLYLALARLECSHQFYLLIPGSDEAVEGITQIEVFPRSNNLFSRARRLFFSIPRIAKKLELDVLIEPAHIGPMGLSKRIKRVTVIHDLTPILFPKWHTWFSSRMQMFLLPRVIQKTDLIITNSEHTRSDILRVYNVPKEKVVRTYLGIESYFKPYLNPAPILHKYGIHKDYLLYLGTIEPRKNIIRIIAAYQNYRMLHPRTEIQLILAGKIGWRSQKILEAINNSAYSKDIILLGYVDRIDMPALYSGARLFLYLSLYEGFGLPAVEAMACGVPVLISNNSSLPEVTGKFARKVNPKNVNNITKAISEELQRSKQTNVNQVKFARQFRWDKTAQETVWAIESMF